MRKISLHLFAILIFTTLANHSNAQKKYNIIFINIDDLGISFDAYNNPFVPAPNFARLAQHGVMFKNVYTQYSLCSPSRTSCFSGKRVRTTKITSNEAPIRSFMDSDYHFINQYFHDFGYRTESYGKFTCKHEIELTWDYYYNGQRNGFAGIKGTEDDESTSLVTPPSTNEEQQIPEWYIDTVSKSIYETDDGLETTKFLENIDTLSHQPHFINLGLETHEPFTPLLSIWNKIGDQLHPELLQVDANGTLTNVYGNGSGNVPLPDSPPDDLYDIPQVATKPPLFYADSEIQRIRHAYYAETMQMDSLLGNVIDKLDEKNLWDSSVVILWSDHGLSMGEHLGQWLKINMFEEALRVPMIICAPGRQKGVVCNQLVELVDIFQTLTELCGLPPQGNQEGSSIVPLLDNPSFDWKKAMFANQKRILNGDTLLGTAVQTKLWHYNNWQEGGEELYDINADSTEITNLSLNPAYSSVMNRMRTLLTNDWQGALPPVYPRKTYYRDYDGDGYGTTADSLWAYALPAGYVLKQGDCDDTRATIHPGADEKVCNGRDDNCNNKIDENKPVPTITANGSLDICATGQVVLTSNSGADFTYQWKKDNVDIAGATKKTYRAKSVGSYTVEITYSGCASLSKNTVVTSSCLVPYQADDSGDKLIAATKAGIAVYPNPSTGITTLSFTSAGKGKIAVTIYNSTGQPVYSQRVNAVTGNNTLQLNLSHLSAGFYQLQVAGSEHVKLIIER